MKDIITIGLPSKGRLKEKSISFFNDNGLKIIQNEKERNYFGTIENKPKVKIIFLHAKEIIQRLGDGTLDIGVSGLDLLNCLLYTSPSPRDVEESRMPSSA